MLFPPFANRLASFMFLGQVLSLTFCNFLKCRRGRSCKLSMSILLFPELLFSLCVKPLWGPLLTRWLLTNLTHPPRVRGIPGMPVEHQASCASWVLSFNLSGALQGREDYFLFTNENIEIQKGCHLCKVTQLVSGRVRIWTQTWVLCLCPCVLHIM